jgi:hypothetical protein
VSVDEWARPTSDSVIVRAPLSISAASAAGTLLTHTGGGL